MESLLDKLSLTTNLKTIKLIELKTKIYRRKSGLIFYKGVCIILFIILMFSINRYIAYCQAFIFKEMVNNTYKKLDLIMLCIFAFFVTILIIKLTKLTEIKTEFNNLRKDLIDTIGNEFCTCKNSCNCKDLYIAIMKKEFDIDMVFKVYTSK